MEDEEESFVQEEQKLKKDVQKEVSTGRCNKRKKGNVCKRQEEARRLFGSPGGGCGYREEVKIDGAESTE